MRLTRMLSLLALATLLTLSAQAQDANRKLKTKIDPVYPEIARNMRIEGAVRLEVQVTSQGTVKEAKILGGNPLLASSALEAVKRWRYETGPEETVMVIVEFKR